MAPLSTIAPFLFAGLIIAVVGVLTASVGIRARRRDYRRILATGATASGVVTSIESRSGTGPCRVQVEYPTGDPGRRAQFTQETSVQAMQRLGLVLGSSLQVRFLRESPRAAFAPSLVVAEQQPAYRSALDEEQTLNRVYVVAFTSPAQTSATVRSFTNSFRWMGPGLVCLTEHGVRFVARRARWFRASRKDTLEVDLERIVNVESHGIAVRVEITDPGAGTRHVTFWTATASEAADLAARLPATRTASFVPLMSEASEFSERLATLMPTTFVTNLIFGVNVSAFVVSLAFGAGLLAQHPEVLIRLGSNFTPLTRSGEWWRLLTNTFLHFGILHIAFNMWALATNGPLAERLYGSTRYLLIYLSAGIAGSAASLWWHPVVNGAGASGAIFGIFGALLAFFLRRHGGVPLSVIQAHRTSIGIFIAYALFNGARVKGIDNAAHLGGLVTGLVLSADRSTLCETTSASGASRLRCSSPSRPPPSSRSRSHRRIRSRRSPPTRPPERQAGPPVAAIRHPPRTAHANA
jgi:membrane associated rhomboid family serine protease